MTTLKGITWDHARGYDPMVATADAFMAANPGVTITWQKRSLKEFGDYPIEKLAEIFDLLVIDHPFVGFAAHSRYLVPLDEHIDAAYLADQAENSVGRSHISYHYGGHHWALAIDAAAQISSYRSDLLGDAPVPQTWDDVLALARRLSDAGGARVAMPVCPIDSLMSLFSICAALGEDPCATREVFVSRDIGRQALDIMVELTALGHPQALNWNPIQLYDVMSRTDEVAYCPLAFGYSNYGRAGYAPHILSFANVPQAGHGLKGGILGGTGYAISVHCEALETAVAYGKFVASGEVQRGLYVQSGGQPGHRSAWTDQAVNAASNNFFRDTLASLDSAYLRPRYHGYMSFQEEAWYAVHAFLRDRTDPDALLDQIDRWYRDSLPPEKAN